MRAGNPAQYGIGTEVTQPQRGRAPRSHQHVDGVAHSMASHAPRAAGAHQARSSVKTKQAPKREKKGVAELSIR